MIRRTLAVLALTACHWASLPSPAIAARYVGVHTTDGLKRALENARPGTRVLVAPGRYTSCFLSGLRGRPNALIEIIGRDPARPPIFFGGGVAFQLVDCQYVSIDGIVATGAEWNNVQVGDGSHHIILRNVRSTDVKGKGNRDGIKMPGLTDFLVAGCTVEGWGGGGSAIDMVGCAHGLIFQSRFSLPSPGGDNANGIQIKGGSHSIGVYRCRFDDANYRAVQFGGLTGNEYFFQGNLEQGYEALDLLAMGNIFIKGEAPVAFVSCTGCRFEYNTVLRPRKYVARILKEGGTKPTVLNSFARNLIVWDDLPEPFDVGPGVDLATFRVADNYWFNATDPMRGVPKLPVDDARSVAGESPHLDRNGKPGENSSAVEYGAYASEITNRSSASTRRFPWAWQHAQPPSVPRSPAQARDASPN